MKTTLPSIFIGSSSEDLDVAYAIQENLEYDADVTVWDQDIFKLTENTLNSLINAINEFDYAIFVFNANDDIVIRKNNYLVARDNVIFEMGLFIGKIGKEKVFYVMPNGIKDFHLPTDLTGTTPGKYRVDRKDRNIKAALGPFCNQVRKIINPRTTLKKEIITPEKVFAGKWKNFYIDNSSGNRFFGSEEVIIKNKNEYYANDILSFKIIDFQIDMKQGLLTFTKKGINDDRTLKNVLKIMNEVLFVGHENDNIEIKYEKMN